MIVDFKAIDLFGKKLFTWAMVKTPVRVAGPMAGQEACFAYVLEGESDVYSETEKANARAGEAVLSKCGNYVTQLLSKNEKGLFSTITIHFHEEVLKEIYQHSVPHFLKQEKSSLSPNMIKVEASELVRQYMENLKYYFHHQELLSEDMLVLKLKEIILLLFQTQNSPQVHQILSSLFAKRTFTFKEVTEAHICSPISLTELATLTHHSLSSFKREFKKLYSETPGNYIIRKRTEKVAELLLLSDDTISNIAFDCGFKSLAHLSRVFRLKYGMSPSVYRLSKAHGAVSDNNLSRNLA